MEIVEDYGGQIIFTPGDIVYSSSSLINLAAPEIKIEKLLILMESSENLPETNQGQSGAHNSSCLPSAIIRRIS